MFILGSQGSTRAGLGTAPVDYAPVLDVLPDAVLIHDAATGRILEVNPAFITMFGYGPGELEGLDVGMLSAGTPGYAPEDAQARILEAKDKGRNEFLWRSRRADGSLFWSEVRLVDGGPGSGRVIAVVRDITERTQAEEAQNWAEEKFERIFRASPASIMVASYPDGRVMDVNEPLMRLTGYTREELVGHTAHHLWVSEEARDRYIGKLRTEGRVVGMEALFRIKNGDVRVGRLSGEILELASGPCLLSFIDDITVRKANKEALLRISRLYAALSLVNQSLVRVTTEDELFSGICKALVEGGGFWAAWIAVPDADGQFFVPRAIHGGGGDWVEDLRIHTSADRPEGRGTIGRAYRERQPVLANDFEHDPLTEPWRVQGRRLDFKAVASFPLRHGGGEVFGVLCLYAREAGYFGEQECALLEEVCGDLTFALEDLAKERRRQQAEAEKTHLRELLQAIIDSTPDLVYAKDPEHRYLLVNRSMAEFLGRPPGEIIGHRDTEYWHEGGAGTDTDLRRVSLDEVEALSGEVIVRETTMTPPRGGEPRLYDTLRAPLRDAGGRIEGVLGYNRDITRMRLQEEQQHALEARLQQTQKLESLGNLAGGVAHDMNNVLGAILGLASIERERAAPATPQHRSMETIVQACVRGREVVQGLLCFARRELEEHQIVDLNLLGREIIGLLSHTTLQKIRFVTDLEPELRCVEGDAGALNHAFMNICVNAVDAMPDGGTITLRTRNGEDGTVTVAFSDTGEGMTEEVALRATEPFFTTKPAGKGTGLGLAMVYGTVQAHKGTLTLLSAPGAGTEVRLAFPGTEATVAAQAPAAKGPEAGPLRILLVDDDEMLRESVADVLAFQGHATVDVGGGQEALDLLARGDAFDLIILDLNMPGMSGAEALPRILDLRPGQKILVSSGFADAHVKGFLDGRPTVRTIGKPFTTQELARKLRDF